VASDGAEPSDWHAVLLDSLAGVPLQAAAELNLSALGAEADALFAHLADLAPEWAAGVEWGEYVCCAAAVVLASGAAYFARGPRAPAVPTRALPGPPEEDR
jgi:hypothetical protein